MNPMNQILCDDAGINAAVAQIAGWTEIWLDTAGDIPVYRGKPPHRDIVARVPSYTTDPAEVATVERALPYHLALSYEEVLADMFGGDRFLLCALRPEALPLLARCKALLRACGYESTQNAKGGGEVDGIRPAA
ncbi:hypothetical protein [Cloacibacillus porcorum]